MRALSFFGLCGLSVLFASMAGCRTKACVDGTLLVELTREGAAANATQLEVEVAIDGAAPLTDTVMISPSGDDGSLEVKLPYAKGDMVVVTIVAKDEDGNALAQGTQTVEMLPGSCAKIDLVLGAIDAGVGIDMIGNDAGEVDGAVTCTSCQLTQLHPHIANTNDTIMLEGQFVAGTTIDFPGATPGQPVTLLTPYHGIVTVPATATSGVATVHSGGMTATQDFRRAAYQLDVAGIMPAETEYPQVEGAHMQSQLPTAVSLTSVVESNGYVFVVGGSTNNGAVGGGSQAVQRLRAQADDTIGYADSETMHELTEPRGSHTTTVIGNNLWAIGGYSGSQLLGTTEYTTVTSTGDIVSWNLGPSLNTPRRGHTATIVGNRLYVIGGADGTGNSTTSIEYATIDPTTGMLGAFQLAGNIGTARTAHATFVTQKSIVVVGGFVASGMPTQTIEEAPLEQDGSLGSFTTITSIPLPTAPNLGPLSSIEVSSMLIAPPFVVTLDATGEPSAATLGMPVPVSDARATLVRDAIQFVGGYDTAALTSIERVRLDGNATLGAFDSYATTVPTGSGGASFVVVGNHLYLIYGTTIERAAVGNDDSIGPFSSLGTAVTLEKAATDAAAGLVSGPEAVIVSGGGDNSMQSLLVNYDDSLQSAQAVPVGLLTTRTHHSMVAAGNALCSLGGDMSGLVECTNFTTSSEVYIGTKEIDLTPVRTGLTSGLFPGQTGLDLVATAGLPNGGVVGEYISEPYFSQGSFTCAAAFASMGFTAPGTTFDLLGQTATVVGPRLYLFGGIEGPNLATTSLAGNAAPLGMGNPSLTPYTAAPTPRNYAHGVRIGNWYYILGGVNTSNVAITTIQRAPLQ